MYVNPFWFGFFCGVGATIIFIIAASIICSMRGKKKVKGGFGNEFCKSDD